MALFSYFCPRDRRQIRAVEFGIGTVPVGIENYTIIYNKEKILCGERKKTKIIATLSDFRANEDFVRQLFEAGMDVVRINSAHLTEEGASRIVEAVRKVSPSIPVILDTKGPEIRVTAVAEEYDGGIEFQVGDRVRVRGTADAIPSTRELIYLNVATIVPRHRGGGPPVDR